MATAEQRRLEESRDQNVPWRKWGPYLSERQWGTVREDYSQTGNAWDYFSHDQARSRAYRWGEDGLAGLSDDGQLLCFALALWNGADPILKERLFGITNSEGNHGEDVKEYYFYLDATPSHSFLRYLYKYPQRRFPYERLIEENARRSRHEPPFNLSEAGLFDDGRYFDVEVCCAKAGADEIHIRITAANRGPEPATLHLLPTLWFRNTWAWEPAPQPEPKITCERDDGVCLVTDDSGTSPDPSIPAHYRLGPRYLYGAAAPALFTDNEPHGERAYGPGHTSRKLHTKDAFHRAICERDPRYDPEAYLFIRESLDFTVRNLERPAEGEKRHVSGQELLEGIRQYALQEFGPMALTVLNTWGIRQTEDFGNIVFNLVEAGKLGETDDDRLEHFADGYDFHEAFAGPFLPVSPPGNAERGQPRKGSRS